MKLATFVPAGGSTSDRIFKVRSIVTFISETCTLKPGDLLSVGR